MDLLEMHFEGEQGGDPELIRLKRSKMASNILDFYRGSAGMFYALWSRQRPQPSPPVWVCGDAHWENVGSYKAKNHVAYFDFTDFDHACLAPASYDLARACSCLYLLKKGGLAPLFLSSYRAALVEGKPYHIEAEVARGIVARLLSAVKNRSQRKFIKAATQGGRLVTDGEETFPLPFREKRAVAGLFRKWSLKMKNPKFFELLDICGSASGVGILGRRRYLALIRGRNAPHLLDIKEAAPSQVADRVSTRQPTWSCEAQRIAEVQRMIQYVPIARLGWTGHAKESFVISEYQPAEDRVDSFNLSKGEFRDFAVQWGSLLGWAHLRGGGWSGAATTTQLIDYGVGLHATRQRRMLAQARDVALRMTRLFAAFRGVMGAETP